MLPSYSEKEHESPITPNLKQLYSNFKLVSDAPSYFKHFEAKSLLSNEIHTIRVLDGDSSFVQNNFETAATLFIQEIMRLCSTHPNEVLVETFQIYNNNIAVATKSFLPLTHVQQIQLENQLDIESSNIIRPQNVYQLSTGAFSLGDWAKAMDGGQMFNPVDGADWNLQKVLENDAEEIYALGTLILELNGIQPEDVSKLREIQNMKLYNSALLSFIDESVNLSEPYKALLQRMISKDPAQRPHLKELLDWYEEFRNASHMEDSNIADPLLGTRAMTLSASESRKGSLLNRIDVTQSVIIDRSNINKYPEENKQQERLLKSQISVSNTERQKLFAWCCDGSNEIRVYDYQNQQEYCSFNGARLPMNLKNTFSLKYYFFYWTHVREIADSNLLISLNHNPQTDANFEVFDISNRKAQKMFSFEAIQGEVGYGDIGYNPRKNLAALIGVKQKKLSHHIFDCNTLQVVRRVAWPTQQKGDCMTGYSFDYDGRIIAAIDDKGFCLLTDVESGSYVLSGRYLHQSSSCPYNRCKWSPLAENPAVFVKYDRNKLNALDVEKKVNLFDSPIALESSGKYTYSIDCRNDGNLIAAAGEDKKVRIYDHREGKIVKTIENLRTGWISCVRWSGDGQRVSISSGDKTAKVIDFGSGMEIFSGKSTEGSKKDKSFC